MGKFFNGRVNTGREKLIKFGIIAIGIILIIIIISLIAKANSKNNQERLELKDNIEMEINGEFPQATDYFSVIENCNPNDIIVDTSKVDDTKLGTYEVGLKSKTLEGTAILKVVDKTGPVLLIGDLEIGPDETYDIKDFLVSCEDNSKEECILEYYQGDNTKIDYSSITEKGNYEIKIIAKDSSGNTSEIQTANLTITDDIINDEDPSKKTPDNKDTTTCQYGNLTANGSVNYPITIIVGNEKTGCAVNRDLWDNKNTQKPLDAIYDEDYKKLKSDVDSYIKSKYPNGSRIVLHPHYIAVINESYKGLIGYSLYVEVYMADANNTGDIETKEYLKLSYYVKSDKTRQYVINEVGLK